MKLVQGIVISAKMQKTVVVRTEKRVKHPRYKKYVLQRAKLKARDEHGCREGDMVQLAVTRRVSKNTCWRVIKVLGRRAIRDASESQGGEA